MYRDASEANGYVRVVFTCGEFVNVRLDQWQVLADAVEFGLEWVDLTDLYGDRLKVRMRHVATFGVNSPASLAVIDAEAEARREHRRLHGDT